VVSAASRTTPRITVAPGGALKRVIVLGAGRVKPQIDAPAHVVVENHSSGHAAALLGRPPDLIQGDRHDPLFGALRAMAAADAAVVWCDWAKEIVVDDGALVTAPVAPLVTEADRARLEDDRARARAAPSTCARKCEEPQRFTLPAFATAADLSRFDALIGPCLACASSAGP
jgi:hypothetical protein